MPSTVMLSPLPPLRLQLPPGLLTTALGAELDSAFRRVTLVLTRTATSVRISSLPLHHRSPTQERLVPFLGLLSWAWLSFAGRFRPDRLTPPSPPSPRSSAEK